MPYKDPERKRDWEWAHRHERTVRRRQQRHSDPDAVQVPPTDGSDSQRSRWPLWVAGGIVLSVLGLLFAAPPGFGGTEG